MEAGAAGSNQRGVRSQQSLTQRQIPSRPVGERAEPNARDTEQINLTDQESRIMLGSGKSFQRSYNVQAGWKPKAC